MRLRFWRREPPPTLTEAQAARIAAERELERTKAETPWYEAVAKRHQEIQRVNHLGLNAVRAIRGDTK